MKYPGLPRSAAAHDRAVAELSAGLVAPAPAYTILRPAQPYDLATPGTPRAVLDVAKAAAAGGVYACTCTFALAADAAGGMVASLALRFADDLPGRPRRAWVVYVRAEDEGGAVAWRPNGAALLDGADAGRPMRQLGVTELKAVLAGVPYVPLAPRPAAPKLQCQTCDKITSFSVSTWRPYARHRCETRQSEGRS